MLTSSAAARSQRMTETLMLLKDSELRLPLPLRPNNMS